MTLTFGSLFAGVGGFDLAFERSGMICSWQVEIDQKCRQVLAHHWPNVERMNDVKEITKPPTVDLICGGFPCQDLSVAGRRAGLDGEQSGLWFEFLRIIDQVKPQWVVIENVPGLLSSYSGDDPPSDLQPGREWQTTEESDLAAIFRGLAKCGYWWAYQVLDAQYWGVPQRRRRVFIVASLGDWRGPAKVLFESESSPWDIAPGREAGARVADTLTKCFAKHRGSSAGKDSYPRNVVYQCHGSNVGPLGTLRKGDGSVQSGVPFVASPLTHHHGRNCGEDTFIPTAFTERTRAQGRTLEAQEEIAYALTSPGSGGRTHSRQVLARQGVRRFTPLECERLQGFPDRWSAIEGMSDSARYKMLGNAVAVPVVQWMGERIMEVHARSKFK